MNLRSVLRWLAVAAWLLPAPFAAAQPAPKPDEPQFPLASRIGLAPPAGMTLSTTFPGFEDSANNVFIRLIAMPEEAFAELDKTMTSQALKKQNITMEKREPFALGPRKGFLIVARQEADNIRIRKWLLVAPIDGVTAFVSVEIPVSDKTVYSDAVIRASLATLAARPTIPVEEQLSLVPFKLGDLAGFKVAGLVPGRAIQLTDGDKDAPVSASQAQMVIGISAGSAPAVADRDNFARMAFTGPPNVKDVRIVSSEPMRIGGQPGHELRASGKDVTTGADVEMVQWLRFGSGAYVRILGIASKDGWVAALSRFRTVRDALDPR